MFKSRKNKRRSKHISKKSLLSRFKSNFVDVAFELAKAASILWVHHRKKPCLKHFSEIAEREGFKECCVQFSMLCFLFESPGNLIGGASDPRLFGMYFCPSCKKGHTKETEETSNHPDETDKTENVLDLFESAKKAYWSGVSVRDFLYEISPYQAKFIYDQFTFLNLPFSFDGLQCLFSDRVLKDALGMPDAPDDVYMQDWISTVLSAIKEQAYFQKILMEWDFRVSRTKDSMTHSPTTLPKIFHNLMTFPKKPNATRATPKISTDLTQPGRKAQTKIHV